MALVCFDQRMQSDCMIDLSSGLLFFAGVIKAGFAGDQIPKCIFPNFIGRPKHVRVMAGALEGDTFIGKVALYCLL